MTNIISQIMGSGVLCDINIGYWTAAKSFSASDLGLEREDLPDSLYNLGKRQLIPAEEINLFRSIEANSRRITREFGRPFPVGGCAFIPAPLIERVEAHLISERKRFMDHLDDLLTRYRSLRKSMLEQWRVHLVAWRLKMKLEATIEDLMSRIEAVYPDADSVRSRCHFEWSFFSISFGSGGESFGISEEKASTRNEIMKRYRPQAEKQIQDWLNTVVRQLRTETLDVMTHWKEVLSGGSIRSNQLTALREFINRYASLNFVGDTQLQADIDRLGKLLPEQVSDINNNEKMTNRLTTAISEIGAHAKLQGDAVVKSIVAGFMGEGKRVVSKMKKQVPDDEE